MSDLWIDRVLQELTRNELGTVLCLGRAHHGVIDALPKGTAGQIVQLEPVPERAEDLGRNAPDRYQILPHAFGPSNGTGTLHHFTMTKLASLRPATGLSTLFPGLRTTDTTEVQIWSAATLMAKVNLNASRANLLILGAPGEEAEAIAQFEELGTLTQFDYVLTPLPRLALYEGSLDGAELATQLEAKGLRTLLRDEADPDQQWALFQRDKVWAALFTKHGDLQQEHNTLLQELEAAKKQITHQAKSADDAHAALSAERDALSQELEAVRAQADTAEQSAQQAHSASEALSIAVGSQAILQANLTELQDRYAALLSQKQQLDAFVSEVNQRLSALCDPDQIAEADEP